MALIVCLLLLCGAINPGTQPLIGANVLSSVKLEAGSEGLSINGQVISHDWSIDRLDQALKAKGRWIIPSENERSEALRKFGRPMTNNMYIYDDLGLMVYVHYKTNVIQSVLVHFGGMRYSNSPKNDFEGVFSVSGITASRKSTISTLRETGIRQSGMPFSYSVNLGNFRYSFIFDDGTLQSNLAEISISLMN